MSPWWAMVHITEPSCNCHYLAFLAVPIRRGPGLSWHTEALHHCRLETTKQGLGWKGCTGLDIAFFWSKCGGRFYSWDLEAFVTFLHGEDFCVDINWCNWLLGGFSIFIFTKTIFFPNSFAVIIINFIKCFTYFWEKEYFY